MNDIEGFCSKGRHIRSGGCVKSNKYTCIVSITSQWAQIYIKISSDFLKVLKIFNAARTNKSWKLYQVPVGFYEALAKLFLWSYIRSWSCKDFMWCLVHGMCKNEINKKTGNKKYYTKHRTEWEWVREEGSERNRKRLHQTTSTLQMESLFVSRIAIKKVVFGLYWKNMKYLWSRELPHTFFHSKLNFFY